MHVRQFRYGADNLAYLIHTDTTAMAVDGGALTAIRSYLKEHQLHLVYVANTHTHADHTTGSQTLADEQKAVYLDNATLRAKGTIALDGKPVRIHHTPGHTTDSLVFDTGAHLVTGDTLFNGTIGNCFSGDVEGFYRSIRFLMSFDPETLIYAGHDYVKDSLAFAAKLEPDNIWLARFAETYTPYHVVSTLAQEFQINPYLRFNEPEMIAVLEKRGLPTGSEYDRWMSVFSIE